ncbi:MAG: nodulation protein NfeD [Woeseia sp.]
MSKIIRHRLSFRLRQVLLYTVMLLLGTSGFAQAAGLVLQLDLEGPLGVATAEYITGGIQEANERNAALVIIRMDTPGGLVEPMRDIVSAILASGVPVATYVSPGGARADSAGTYILLASHVAAMAPTTHLGAATPVSLGGEESPKPPTPLDRTPGPGIGQDEGDDQPAEGDSAPGSDDAQRPGTAMERKVLNDAIAYIRGLAEAHGRNADWAELAVRDAATLTANDALEQNVIDVIAADQAELLELIDGRVVKVRNEDATLVTSGAFVENIEPDWRTKFLSAITNPQVALLLMLVGIYGLVFEGWNPGAIVPGVVGVVCLLLAAYALQVLPVNYAGVALILVGIALIIAEAFAPSFGVLGLGGIAAFIFGSIMMFDSDIPGFGISLTFVIALALVAGLSMLWLATYLVKLRRRGAVSGQESIVGGVGVAMETFSGDGRIWLEGEAWHAMSNAAIQKDQAVRVTSMDGLVLHVEPVSQQAN